MYSFWTSLKKNKNSNKQSKHIFETIKDTKKNKIGENADIKLTLK